MQIGDVLTNDVTLQQKWYISKNSTENTSSIVQNTLIGTSSNNQSKILVGNEFFNSDDLSYVYVLCTASKTGYNTQQQLLRSTEKIRKSNISIGSIDFLNDTLTVGGLCTVKFTIVSDSTLYDGNTQILQ